MAILTSEGDITGADGELMNHWEVAMCKQNFRNAKLNDVVIVFIDEQTHDVYHITAFNEDVSEVYYIKERLDGTKRLVKSNFETVFDAAIEHAQICTGCNTHTNMYQQNVMTDLCPACHHQSRSDETSSSRTSRE